LVFPFIHDDAPDSCLSVGILAILPLESCNTSQV